MNISQNIAKFTATAPGSQNYFDYLIIKKILEDVAYHLQELKCAIDDIDLDTSQAVFKRNLKRCLQHGISNVHEKWLKTTVVIVTWFYRVCYLYKCVMVFVIVAFMLCYLESLILRLLSSMFIFFSICTLCTLLIEGDKTETEIGSYKPLGFLSHLQYKCYLCEYVSILIFGSNIYRHIYV